MISILILAQLAQPVPRVGSCPIGYYISAGYCVPSRTAKPAIVKNGTTCPLGYYSTGSFCKQTN
jgi:hypothetical protein